MSGQFSFICHCSQCSSGCRSAFEGMLLALILTYDYSLERPPLIPVPREPNCDNWNWDCSIPVRSPSEADVALLGRAGTC